MLEGQSEEADKLSLAEYLASQSQEMAVNDAEKVDESNVIGTFLSKKIFSEIELVSQNLIFEVDDIDFTLSDLLQDFKMSRGVQNATGDLATPVSNVMTPPDGGASATIPQLPADISSMVNMPSNLSPMQSTAQSLAQMTGMMRGISSPSVAGISQPGSRPIQRSIASNMPGASPISIPSITPSGPGVSGQGQTPGQGPSVSMPSSDDASVMAMIKEHEGVRTRPYKDTSGLWTVGVGHMIGPTLPQEWNRELTMQEVDQLFAKDYAEHKAAAQRIPGFEKLNQTGQAAVIDLTFNMGPAWHRKFPAAAAALAKGDVQTFANEMQNSAWYRQVGRRAPKIVAMIRGGAGDASQQAQQGQQVPGAPGTGAQLAQAGASVEVADQAQMRSAGQRLGPVGAAGIPPLSLPQNIPQAAASLQSGETPIALRLQNLQV